MNEVQINQDDIVLINDAAADVLHADGAHGCADPRLPASASDTKVKTFPDQIQINPDPDPIDWQIKPDKHLSMA